MILGKSNPGFCVCCFHSQQKKRCSKLGAYFKPYLLAALLLIQYSHAPDLHHFRDSLALGNGSGKAFPDTQVDQVLRQGRSPLFPEAKCKPGARAGKWVWDLVVKYMRDLYMGLIPCSLPGCCLEMSWIHAHRNCSVLLWQLSQCKEKDKKGEKYYF